TTQKFRISDWSTTPASVRGQGRGAGRDDLSAIQRDRGSALLQSPAMANIKSQIKRNRQNDRRRARNKSIQTALKTSVKKVRSAVETGDEQATDLVRKTAREFDRAVAKGAVHKRSAARRKSRLARSIASSS